MGVHVRLLNGFLGLRIYYRGREEWVGTQLAPTSANRGMLEAKALVIGERIHAGVALHRALLDVLGDCPPRLLPRTERANRHRLRDFHDLWIVSQKPPLLRVTEARKRKLYFDRVILPELGGLTFDAIDRLALEAFRQKLVTENIGTETKPRTRTVKTAKNIIEGHFRALWRAAEKEGLAGGFPSLEWPRTMRAKPDPFDADERDKIIAWFAEREAWLEPWLSFLFWTGMRPGEAAALRWQHVDLKRGSVLVERSRVESAEELPKTRGSSRDVKLLEPALAALKRVTREIDAPADQHVFRTPQGKGMTDSWWPKRGASRKPSKDEERGVWWRCLRSLGIRPRRSYCARHTFIAWALSAGMNQKALAEYCGTSSPMIEQHYGKYIGTDALGPLTRAIEAGKYPVISPSIRRKSAKSSPSDGAVKVGKS